LAAGAFGLSDHAPVLAKGLETLELVVTEFDQIACGAVVEELEDIAHRFLARA
jgi:hypothetical protein